MFRAGKPSVQRTLQDKSQLPPPNVHAPIPKAIIPEHSLEQKEPLKKFPEKSCEDTTGKLNLPTPKLPLLPLDDDITTEEVATWEKTLQHKPFFGEIQEEENLFRDVREDRKIQPGNDPLISSILDMFPLESSEQ